MYLYTCICLYIYIHTSLNLQIRIHLYSHIYTRAYRYTCASMSVNKYTFIHVYVSSSITHSFKICRVDMFACLRVCDSVCVYGCVSRMCVFILWFIGGGGAVPPTPNRSAAMFDASLMHLGTILQHSATHCNAHTAIHCNTRQHTKTYSKTHCSTLRHNAAYCSNILQQHTAAHFSIINASLVRLGSTLQHTATNCNMRQFTATQVNARQYIAIQCNTLRHTATLLSIFDASTLFST